MGIALLIFLLAMSPWPHRFMLDPTLIHTRQSGNIRSELGTLDSTASYSRSKVASAQGLSVPDESLGAGELAALDMFGLFQDLLELSDDFTGGKGGGGKGTGGRGRSSAPFEDAKTLHRQQLELYHIAGSPSVYHSFNSSQTIGGRNYLPKLRDQGQCSTCVGHAVASAAEASVASTLRVDATDWDVSPQSMYYCTAGGKTCASGWQLEEALYELEENPSVIRPSNCTAGNLVEPEIGSWTGVCAAAAIKCPLADNSLPWMSCSFKTLSTFWQIQQAIRQNGAVISRITIYDDFTTFFESNKTGLENRIYTPRPRAKKLYGHAAIIVGYDNINMAWTLLNSWGTRSTKDGLFRIAMGQAGVGAPDASYSVTCEPRAGTNRDPHEFKPWKRNQRKPVRLINPEADRTNLAAPCYYYDAVPGDTASSVADAFLLDIRRFAQDNAQVFKPVEVTVDLNASLTTAQLTAVLATVMSLQQFPVTAEPYFRCTDSTGDVQECRSDLVEPCSGINNCTLVYQEPDVSISPANQVLRVCNISLAIGQFEAVALFASPSISQPRALRRLLDVMGYTDVTVPADYCDPAAWSTSNNPWSDLFDGRWVQQCVDGWISNFILHVGEANDTKSMLLDQSLADVLLLLENLQELTIYTAPGSTIPPQLGALKRLQKFSAVSSCWKGMLPANLGIGWPDITVISIREVSKQPSRDCGIQGSLPVLWGTTMPKLAQLNLSPTRLSGSLPPEYSQMSQMALFEVPDSRLSGVLPSSYAAWRSIRRIDLSGNTIEGEVPTAWSALKNRLAVLNLYDNPRLEGCIPLTPFTIVTYDGTQMTGLCTDNKQEIEQQQADALRSLLNPLLNGVDPKWRPVGRAVRDFSARTLSDLWAGEDGQETYVLRYGDSRGELRFILSITNAVVYMASISVTGAALDLTVLPDLVAALPGLKAFRCLRCVYNRQNKAAMQLPAALAAKAPETLTTLQLTGSQIQGTLPIEWGQWSSLVTLDLHNNVITGTLPASWKDMSSLKSLDLELNSLVGTLPPQWGSGGISQAGAMYLSRNPRLTGSIPVAWSTFQGGVFLNRTGVSGCIPDQLYTSIFWDKESVPCSQDSSELAILINLRTLLDPDEMLLQSWNRGNGGPAGVPGSIPPGYCRKFLGVGCNNLNKVSSLDLAQLSSRGLQTRVSLDRVLQLTSRFSALQVLNLSGNADTFSNSKLQPRYWMRFQALQQLDLSGCGLSGKLPPSLAAARDLQYLNLSGNAGLTGPLPPLWGALTKLQVLDVSRCGLSGELPGLWASLQRLREFRASRNSPGLSGSLPESWGMLTNLEVLEIGRGGLTGSLPAIWADPLAMAARAAVMLATARRHVTDPSMVIPGLSLAESQELARAAAAAAVAILEQAVSNKGAVKLGMLNLQHLVLFGNQLQGQLPAAFAAMHGLEVIRLDGNTLTGTLPVAWAALRNMKPLKVFQGLQVHGFILVESCDNLGSAVMQVLNLSSNHVSGPLPEFWGTLVNLQFMDLSHNPLSGPLPASLGALMRLQELHLSSAKLTGRLPAIWSGLRQVRIIDLSGNLLRGKMPFQWGWMANSGSYKLRKVDLSGNPCMKKRPLLDSIKQSKITASRRVTVITTGVGLGGPACA